MSVITLYLIFSMLAVLYYDLTRYTIPNWLNGGLLLVYPIAVFMVRSGVSVDWPMALAGMAGVLVVGLFIYSRRWMGGGDIKLLTVLALWVGLNHLAEFLMLVALLGGVFVLIIWGIRKTVPHLPERLDRNKVPRLFRDGQPVPYGVAISSGFLMGIWQGWVPVIQ